uniref:Uncharacterized protein n=1 Tax=viral metagenome TaxID=1070528 RepID=A0A6C0AQZ5_9ZZZZ
MYTTLSFLLLLSSSVNSFHFIGSTKPLEYFDPLGFSNNKPLNELIKLREAELKHSRWAMISAVAIPTTELVSHQPAIHVLDNTDMLTVASFIGFVGASELQSMLLGWKNPFTNSSNYFLMKSDYQPGDLGFNTKKSFLGNDKTFMLNAELNNGRLAMIGSLGMIVQELVTNQPIF